MTKSLEARVSKLEQATKAGERFCLYGAILPKPRFSAGLQSWRRRRAFRTVMWTW